MHRKYNKFLIVSFVGVLALGAYSYFYNNLKSEAANEDSALSSSLTDTASTTSAPVNNTINEDTAFLMKLNSLKRIKIDVSLFENQAFKLLVSNNIKIDPLPYGRLNPFSPTDQSTAVAKLTYTLKTNPVGAITNKSAVLNGSLEGGATSNNIYFEYGTVADKLDKTTPKVIPSLVGNFSSNINLLNSKTTYYYRSAANINGAIVFGDVMTFNTN